jgi:hypothetical protein
VTSGARVTVRVDDSALAAYASHPSGQVMGWLVTVANRVMNNSAARVPVDTGYLRSTRTISPDPTRAAVQIAYRARYAIYVHDGVRGRPGRPYLADALREEVSRL